MELNDLARYLDSTGWLGVGALGVLLFLLGIYKPALGFLPGGAYVEIGLAVAGGCVAVIGFSFYYDRREYERSHPRRSPLKGRAKDLALGPSFEVYRPGPPPAEPPAEPAESTEP